MKRLKQEKDRALQEKIEIRIVTNEKSYSCQIAFKSFIEKQQVTGLYPIIQDNSANSGSAHGSVHLDIQHSNTFPFLLLNIT